MDIKDLQKNWDVFGKTDPLWAILTCPDKKKGKWDEAEFLKTGIETVRLVMEDVISLDVKFARSSALDFGCGAGRLTQALAEYFENCSGVDIAPSMIEIAKKYNRHGDRCRYYLNETDDLRIFKDNSFDFILSFIVLQHMRPEYSKNYIKEFVRILAPGGLAVFQVPSELKDDKKDETKKGLKNLAGHLMKKVAANLAALRDAQSKREGEFVPKMEMYGVPKREVLELLKLNRAKIIEVKENGWSGDDWHSYTYYFSK